MIEINDSILERLVGVQEDQIRSTRSLEETLEKLLPLLVKATAGSGVSSRATVNQNDRTPMWICVVLVVALSVALLTKESNKTTEALAVQASITRLQGQQDRSAADMRELRGDIQDLRGTDNAIRAYINTGILKPKPQEVGKK